METRYKERCIYCGGDVYYHGDETLIKCDWCGQTIPVMKFQGEMTRVKKTEEENALIKQQLKEAEKEKQAADDRLFAALSDLSQIQNSQDTLGKIVLLLTEGQEDALQSLEFLKGVSERLISTQNDIVGRMGLMQEIAIRLQKIDAAEQDRQSVMNEFILWSQQIREEDVQRLQGLASSADELLEGQREINSKVDKLKAAADLHQQTLEAFQSQYTRDKLEKIQKLYRQAADYQHDRMYDKAEEYYRRMLTEGEEDAEVYWRLIMCHYCMFYEKDDKGRMIPIILNPDLADPAEMSLHKELASHITEKERSFYEAKLQEINRILDEYRLLKDEARYDIFISVKQNEDGHYTSDSDVASDLYDFLASHGLRVFNSRRTPIPAGHEYEPYIISALISAKALIVVGTSSENMESKWVKNEWSRFQWLQFREKEKTGKTERVLFCYLAKGMRANQIPRALHPDRQAIYDGVKAQNDLLAALSFLEKENTVPNRINYAPRAEAKPDYDRVRKQMTLWLLRGKYDKVLEKYEQLNEEGLFLSYVSLHMAALCANNKVEDIRQIVDSSFILENAPEYKAAILLCEDEKAKQELEDLLAQNKQWRNRQSVTNITEKKKDNNSVLKTHDAVQEKKRYIHEESIVRFGRYIQKVNGSPEPIEWKVLERENGRMLLISKYALDCQPYNTYPFTSASWATCSLRKWLNETFLNNAFNTEEKKKILSSKVTAENTSSGNDTTDKVFLLSITEANKYFSYDKERECKGTGYCHAHRVYTAGHNNCWWWLRSPGSHSFDKAVNVTCDGYVNSTGNDVRDGRYGVRPALWLKLESSNLEKENKQEKGEITKAVAEEQSSSQGTPDKWCYLGGVAVSKRNYEEAAKWFLKAAEKGHAIAQNNLGELYEHGNGVKMAPEQAVFWYQKAAEQGNVYGQYNLGTCYENGSGVKKDQKQAISWYQKAADQGHVDAKEKVRQLTKKKLWFF